MIGLKIAMFLIKLVLIAQLVEALMYGVSIMHQIYGLLCLGSVIVFQFLEMIYYKIMKECNNGATPRKRLK